MSTTKVTLCAKSLRAMLHCAAKKDDREYLNGITIHPVGEKAVLIASDGRIIAGLMTESTISGASEQIIIPRAVIESIPRTASTATITQRSCKVTIRVYDRDRVTSESFGRHQKTDVDMIMVMAINQKAASTEPVTVNPAIISGMLKTITELARATFVRQTASVQMTTCGKDNAIRVLAPMIPGFAGLIAPMREQFARSPEWLEAAAAKSAKKNARSKMESA